MKHQPISRRTALKGLGTAVALPFLDAMAPALSSAAESASSGAPVRLAYLYVPNGAHMQDWTPAATGTGFDLPRILEPLQAVKDDLCVLSGLTHKKANANGDGGGDHARAMATFLTGTQARKTHGADIRAGVSADQLAAQQVGKLTRFASLELGCEQGQQAGNCDSGYSCAYSGNIAWKSESTPVAKEVNPRLVFDRLFSNGREGESDEARAKRERYSRSVLDFVLEDARLLKNRLGATDNRKLDEYLTAVRELEQRIARADQPQDTARTASFPRPGGIPKSYQEHIRLMCDLQVLAFQGDVTRISTLVFANEGSNRSYPFLDIPEGHHELSHHGGNQKKHDKIRAINRFHVTQFAYLLEKLKAAPEGSGTLLDNCMVVYGSGIGDGDAHNHDNLPILLAGKGGGSIAAGRHVQYERGTPLMNLNLALLERMGVKVKSLGDSTGVLDRLEG